MSLSLFIPLCPLFAQEENERGSFFFVQMNSLDLHCNVFNVCG